MYFGEVTNGFLSSSHSGKLSHIIINYAIYRFAYPHRLPYHLASHTGFDTTSATLKIYELLPYLVVLDLDLLIHRPYASYLTDML